MVQQTSLDAYADIDEQTQAEQVLWLIKEKGDFGATCFEMHRDLPIQFPEWKGKPYGTVSARMTHLKKLGLIAGNGLLRRAANNDADVFVAAQYATFEQIEKTKQSMKGKRELVRDDLIMVRNFIDGLIKGNQIKDDVFAKRAPDILKTTENTIELMK